MKNLKNVIFVLLPIMFAFNITGDKETYTLNTANRDKIKTLAIASVYGENMGGIYNIHYQDHDNSSLRGTKVGNVLGSGNTRTFTFTIFEQQKCYDYLEKVLVDKFNGINMSVVPLEKTQPLFADTVGDWTILNEVMGKPAPTEKEIKQLKTNTQMMAAWRSGTKDIKPSFTDQYGMNLRGIGGTYEINSANTSFATMIIDKGLPESKSKSKPNNGGYTGNVGAPKCNDNFAKTFGRVAKKANADGFTIVKMESLFGGDRSDPENKNKKTGFFTVQKKEVGYAIVFLYVYVYTNEGELVFQDEVAGFSKDKLQFEKSTKGFLQKSDKTIYDSNVYVVMDDAIDDAVSQAFSHLKGQ